jgi:hypothetical protein
MEAFNRLSVRERVMIGTLLALAAVAAVVFLLVLPSLDRISTLEREIIELEDQKSLLQQTVDPLPSYEGEYEAALKDFNNYQHFYYSFMDPETIDKTVTTMILDNNLFPERLSLSSISSEPVLLFSPQSLVPKPVPAKEPATGEGEGEGAQGEGADTGATAEGDAAAADPNAPRESRSDQLAAEAEAEGGLAEEEEESKGLQAGTSVYCYTVDVEMRGWMSDLFNFLAAAKNITALEVVSFSYTDPPAEQSVTTKDTSAEPTTTLGIEGGTIVMQLKLYVFVDNGVATQGSAD